MEHTILNKKIVKNNKAKFSPDDEVEFYFTLDAVHIRKIGYKLPKKRSNVTNLKNGKYKVKNGEIKTQKRSKKKIDNPVSLQRSFLRLRRTIEFATSNTIDKAKISITLTYANDCTDTDQLQHDFDIFLKRLRRYVKSHFNNATFSFIKIFEPDEDLAENNKPRWHIHLLIFGLYFIDKKVLAKLWGHADSVHVDSLRGRNPLSVALYYTGYMNVDEDSNPENESKEKKIEKKKRLDMYPRDFAIYSTSRTIRPVKWKREKLSNIIKRFPNLQIVNSASRIIKNKQNKEVNRIDYMNLLREKSKFRKDEYKAFSYKEFE